MCRLIKNIIALFFLLVLAMPITIAVTGIMRQFNLHKKIEARFKTEIIQTITIVKSKINWTKKDKEVLIDGKYFDVKSFIIEEDKIVLTGFYDHREDILAKHIRKLVQSNSETESPVSQQFLKYFLFPAFINQPNAYFLHRFEVISVRHNLYSEDISEIFLSNISPPPKA